jgi:MFS family permease
MRLQRATLLSVGGLIVAVAVAALSVSMIEAVTPWVVVPIWALAGIGMGISLSSTSVLVLGLSAPGQEGRNAASLQVSDALGSVFGVGAGGAVFAAGHTAAGQDHGLFAGIWLGLAAVGVLAALVGRRVRHDEAQPVPVS